MDPRKLNSRVPTAKRNNKASPSGHADIDNSDGDTATNTAAWDDRAALPSAPAHHSALLSEHTSSTTSFFEDTNFSQTETQLESDTLTLEPPRKKPRVERLVLLAEDDANHAASQISTYFNPDLAAYNQLSDMGAFNIIPKEIMQVIFTCFDERTRLRCQRVCRTWKIYAWAFPKGFDFSEWCEQPAIAILKDILDSRVTHTQLRKIKFMDVPDIDVRLSLLTSLPYLEELDVSTCNALNHTAMHNIGQATSLLSLSLHRCGKDVPDLTHHLASLTKLTSLDMGLNARLGDPSLVFVSNLTRLRELEISRCRRLTSEGLKNLIPLTQLQVLDMTSCIFIDDKGMSALGGLFNLKSLRIARCSRIGDAGIQHLTGLTALENLDMRSLKITNASMSLFQQLTNLQYLDLKRCSGLNNDALDNLSNLVNLKGLNLAKIPHLTEKGFRFLVNLTNLRELDLSGLPRLNDAEIPVLGNLRSLQVLRMNECTGFEGNSLQFLNPTCVTELQLEKCVRLTNTAIIAISGLTNLRALNLSSTYIGGGRIAALVNLTNLKTFHAQACIHIDDTQMAYLSSLKNLRFLDLGFCERITDAGIVHLTSLTKLETLYLTRVFSVTQVGLGALKNVSVTQ